MAKKTVLQEFADWIANKKGSKYGYKISHSWKAFVIRKNDKPKLKK